MTEDLIEDKIKTYGERLDNHDCRIDKLEQDSASFRTELKNLCASLNQLTGILKWLIGLGATSLVGFFFYVIQTFIVK